MIALVDESETDDALRFSVENQRRCVVFLFTAFPLIDVLLFIVAGGRRVPPQSVFLSPKI